MMRFRIPIAGTIAVFSFNKICDKDQRVACAGEAAENLDWKSTHTVEGYRYFYNEKTGESSWTLPGAANSTSWNCKWDKKSDGKCGIVRQIILVRHGQYHKEISGSLSSLGCEQARLTGKRLHDLVASYDIAPIKNYYYSTMPRATETSDIILSQLSDLKIKPSPCSMIREGAVARPDPPTNPKWAPTDAKFEEDSARAFAAFKTYFKRPDETEESSSSIVLVSHGNMIRSLVMQALQFPPETWTRLRVFNASITIVEIRSDGVVILRSLGDTGHFPPELITDNEKRHKFLPTNN